MEKELLPVPRLMSSSLFWEVFQRQDKSKFKRDKEGFAAGKASSYGIDKFQSLMSKDNFSFHASEGLRFALKISSEGVQLFSASVLGCNFLLDSDKKPLDVSPFLKFSLDSLASKKELHGVYDCEIHDIRSYKSLSSCKPDTFSFYVSDVLEYNGVETIFIPWEKRLAILCHLTTIHSWFRIVPFLDFNAPLKYKRNFCKGSFSSQRKVIIKERSGLYEVLAQRGAQFRSLDLRSEFESSVLLCPPFLLALQNRGIPTPSFLEEVTLLKETSLRKEVKRAPEIVSGVEVESKESGDIFSVLSLPFQLRKQISEKGELSSEFVGKTAWVEKLDFGSTRWNTRLVAVERI